MAGPVVGVLVVIAVLIAVRVTAGAPTAQSGTRATGGGPLTAAVSGVPPTVLDTVGVGDVKSPPSALTGPALTAQGKPRILYVGAEWCPYCAAERWSLAVALARFGALADVGEVSSSPSDVYPNTATLSFHGASYTSRYLSLTAKELYSNQVAGTSYRPLDALDSAEATLFRSVGGGSFPFIDLGGKYAISGASFDPAVLQGKTQGQIAAALSDPNTPIAKSVDGTANVITAALCRLTGSQPATVCTSAGVVAAAKILPPVGG